MRPWCIATQEVHSPWTVDSQDKRRFPRANAATGLSQVAFEAARVQPLQLISANGRSSHRGARQRRSCKRSLAQLRSVAECPRPGQMRGFMKFQATPKADTSDRARHCPLTDVRARGSPAGDKTGARARRHGIQTLRQCMLPCALRSVCRRVVRSLRRDTSAHNNSRCSDTCTTGMSQVKVQWPTLTACRAPSCVRHAIPWVRGYYLFGYRMFLPSKMAGLKSCPRCGLAKACL